MKKHILLTLVLAVLLPVTLLAHPPKKVVVEYNKESEKLIISMTHGVSDATKHYIESITISVDGEEVKVLEYEAQTSEDSHDVEIEMPDLKSGSEVKVSGKCNKMGSKSASITI